ncbi:MAG: DUF4845 domain-containing protein [Sulfurifustaceae bacterium]
MVARGQRGMTMWGAMFVIGTIVFFLFLGFKLFPVYMEDFKVKTAMDSLMQEPNAGAMTRAEMIERLDKRFDIDMVDNVKPRESLNVQQQGRTKTVRLAYEVQVPLAYNVSALIEFDHAYKLASTQ